MSVFRINKTTNYTVMSNYHLRDKNLSLKAKGLLSYMLSLPDDWDYSINGLVKINKESVRAIRNILNELKENNYLVVNKFQNKKGQFEYEYLIYEIPDIRFAEMDKPPMEDSTQININDKDKIDKASLMEEKHNKLTLELVKREYVSLNDVNLIYYDSLFDELLEEHCYNDLIIVLHYIVIHLKNNDFKDENNEAIINKFGYFKYAIRNNLCKMNKKIDLGY